MSWASKLQPTVAHSTCEAEFIAAAAAAKEALWLRKLAQDIGLTGFSCVEIRGDNQGCLQLAKNPVACGRTKHIDVAHCFIRERWARGEIGLTHIPTGDMVADCLTKQVPRVKFVFCRERMGVCPVA